jgi:hypothetical protein
MRMIMEAKCPVEPFNTLIRKGKAGELLGKILGELKPEHAFFVEQEGCRCAILIINLESPAQIPAFAEPFFLNFNAECRFRPVMTPGDLQSAGLDAIGKKWG